MTFKDNPEYKEVFELKGDSPTKFYIPDNTAEGYHISRFVAASAQNIYSKAGITAELLDKLMDVILVLCNDTKKTTPNLRTDIALIANQVKYRTKYPVDEDCAIRMGAIYIFMEGEDPHKVNDVWTRRKVQMAKDNPDLYAFFLTTGLK